MRVHVPQDLSTLQRGVLLKFWLSVRLNVDLHDVLRLASISTDVLDLLSISIEVLDLSIP